MEVSEAERIFEDYFANKPNIKTFIDATHKFVQEKGYVDTMQGHRRILKEAFSKEGRIKNGALRQSVNTIIQGSGAYCTNMALVYIDKYLQTSNLKSKLVLTVHDSIVVDCPKDEIEEVAKVCKYIMENLPIPWLTIDWQGGKLKYPIEADIEIGSNYNDMVNYDEAQFREFSSVNGFVKYHKDLAKFDNYQDNGMISKEQKEQGQTIIKNNINSYKVLT